MRAAKPVLRQLRVGAKTLMLTINLDMVAFMYCNPSVGGPAKGIVVREIDALGGEMGRNIDKTHIQMRMLNTEKVLQFAHCVPKQINFRISMR